MTGAELRSFAGAGLIQGGGLPAHPDRPWLVVERWRRLEVVDYQTGAGVAVTDRPDGVVRVGWHPARPVLAIGAGKEVRQWDVEADREDTPRLRGHTHDGVMAGYDRTGTLVISSDWSSILRCWDAATGRPLTIDPRILRSLAFPAAPAGRLAAGQEGSRVQLYRYQAGRGLRVMARPDRPKTWLSPEMANGFQGVVCVSRDGRLLAAQVGEDRCAVLDPATGTELAVLPDAWRPIRFLADGALLTLGPRGVERWPAPPVAGPHRIGPAAVLAPSTVGPVDWGADPHGRVLAEPLFDRGLRLLPRGGRPVAAGPQPDVRSAAVSPDGQWVIASSFDGGGRGSVTVYETTTGRAVHRLAAGRGSTRFSPDGASVAVTDPNGGVSVFDAGTPWARRWSREGHACAFDSDGQLLAVGEGRGVICLRAVEDGREVARLEVPDPTRLVPQCFGPDGGRLVATGYDDRQLYVWDLRHLRARLAAEELDWVWPALGPAEDHPAPARIEIVPRGRANGPTADRSRPANGG
jgi:WD40 repeat protein